MSDVLPMDIGVECFDSEEAGDVDGERREEGGQEKIRSLEEATVNTKDEVRARTEAEAGRATAGSTTAGTTTEGEGSGEGGWLDVVLPRLTKLPAVTTRVFQCADPHQRGITVELFEGGWRRLL